MFDEFDTGNKYFLNFDRLKPFFKKGELLSLENLPLHMLQLLAEGHGFG